MLVGMWLVLYTVAGCAEEKREMHTVKGRLLVGEAPAANASVAFHPLGSNAGRTCPVGITRSDGSFRLTTSSAGDGAPEGEYVVTVVWPDPAKPIDECECPSPAEHDLLRGFFADRATSTLRAKVCRGDNAITVEAPDVDALLKKWSAEAK